MTDPPDDGLADLLAGFNDGDPVARRALFDVLYGDLHGLAARFMSSQPPGHSLQATALVHEAYLRLARPRQVACRDERGFVCLVARAMRCVLVDHARRKGRTRRASPAEAGSIDEIVMTVEGDAVELLALDAALSKLSGFDEQGARAVELRFFAGLTVDETASLLGISKRTLERQWTAIRNWLYLEVQAAR